MKTEVDNVNLMRSSQYEAIVKETDLMKQFLEESSDFEKILMYRYVLDAAKAAEKEKDSAKGSLIPLYWLASMELEHTEGVQKYLKGDINLDMLNQYISERNVILSEPETARDDLLYRIIEQSKEKKKEQAALIESIVSQLEQRRQEKNTLKYQLKKFFKPGISKK